MSESANGLCQALLRKPRDAARDERLGYQHDVVIQLQEWLEREGFTYPAMLMEGGLPNFFTINGKAYPDTEEISRGSTAGSKAQLDRASGGS